VVGQASEHEKILDGGTGEFAGLAAEVEVVALQAGLLVDVVKGLAGVDC